MNYNINTVSEDAIAREQSAFMSKVYAWMFGGLLVTAGAAWYVASNESLFATVVNWMLPLILVELASIKSMVNYQPLTVNPNRATAPSGRGPW